jgi:hypothetical protein
MQLTIGERLNLLSILPSEGNFLTMRLVDDLRKELGFSEQELEHINLREEEGRLAWDPDKSAPKEVEFGERSRRIVYDTLAELDKEGKMRAEHLSLCEKFEYTGE